jgi:hypothetical protein
MHRWRLPVLPADYAHHLLVKTVGECDETPRLDRVNTGARAQPADEMRREAVAVAVSKLTGSTVLTGRAGSTIGSSAYSP